MLCGVNSVLSLHRREHTRLCYLTCCVLCCVYAAGRLHNKNIGDAGAEAVAAALLDDGCKVEKLL